MIVRRDLVTEQQLTGIQQLCVLIDGTVRKTPEAIIEIDSPYFTGKLKALCMKRPVYDVIFGNVEGIRDPDEANVHWKPQKEGKSLTERKNAVEAFKGIVAEEMPEVERNDKSSAIETGGAEETRGQRERKEKPLAPLRTSKCMIKDVGATQLKEDQNMDMSLDVCRRKVEERIDGKESGQFAVKKGLLFRVVSRKGKELSQLVVPDRYREEVMQLGHDSIMAGHIGVKNRVESDSERGFSYGKIYQYTPSKNSAGI